MKSHAAPMPPRKGDVLLILIGLLKLFKATLLIVVAVGALNLLHKDVAADLHDWIVAIRADPDNRFIHALLAKLGILSDRDLKAISAGSFFSAALLSLEGVGLLLRKRWAEYVTVVLTASLIPLEVYAIVHRVTLVKIIVTLLNVAIVVYLIVRLWRERAHDVAPISPSLGS